jgi:S1-C subfamily serine protease
MIWLLLPLLSAQVVESKEFSRDLQLGAVQATVKFDVGGSGVIIKRQGPLVYVLTANHVVAEAGTVQVITFSKASYPKSATTYSGGTVIARAKDEDLAVIRFKTTDEMPGMLPLCPPKAIPTGDALSVLSVGCVTGEPPTCIAGAKASKKLVRRPGVKEAVIFWEIDKEPAKGRSGGPLVDRQGRLIGICSGRSGGKGYYCHTSEIHKVLKNNGLRWLAEDDK